MRCSTLSYSKAQQMRRTWRPIQSKTILREQQEKRTKKFKDFFISVANAIYLVSDPAQKKRLQEIAFGGACASHEHRPATQNANNSLDKGTLWGRRSSENPLKKTH